MCCFDAKSMGLDWDETGHSKTPSLSRVPWRLFSLHARPFCRTNVILLRQFTCICRQQNHSFSRPQLPTAKCANGKLDSSSIHGVQVRGDLNDGEVRSWKLHYSCTAMALYCLMTTTDRDHPRGPTKEKHNRFHVFATYHRYVFGE